jgi:hypothetical protein
MAGDGAETSSEEGGDDGASECSVRSARFGLTGSGCGEQMAVSDGEFEAPDRVYMRAAPSRTSTATQISSTVLFALGSTKALVNVCNYSRPLKLAHYQRIALR